MANSDEMLAEFKAENNRSCTSVRACRVLLLEQSRLQSEVTLAPRAGARGRG